MRKLNDAQMISGIGQNLYMTKPVLDLLHSRIPKEEEASASRWYSLSPPSQ